MKTVWPFKAPPVCTAFWNDADWEEYAKAFRPKDYDGGQFDSDAWLAYKAKRLNDMKSEVRPGWDWVDTYMRQNEHSEYL